MPMIFNETPDATTAAHAPDDPAAEPKPQEDLHTVAPLNVIVNWFEDLNAADEDRC